MISYNTIRKNSRLTQFEGTKQMVLQNIIPKTNIIKNSDLSVQSNLSQF
jgi:hypothetical protein